MTTVNIRSTSGLTLRKCVGVVALGLTIAQVVGAIHWPLLAFILLWGYVFLPGLLLAAGFLIAGVVGVFSIILVLAIDFWERVAHDIRYRKRKARK